MHVKIRKGKEEKGMYLSLELIKQYGVSGKSVLFVLELPSKENTRA